MYVLLIVLASVQGDLTIHQLIIVLAAPIIMGVISARVKMGLILGFVVSLIMLIVEAFVIQPEVFANPNIIAAVVLMSLPFVLLSATLGAIGGFAGKRLFK
ncbi:hypothetical protein HXY33_01065 [Candidatus Bathyarchaeota archaeon]|nr:hypothetical protein [Candidatus Bathyarchaeota archaeon]